MPQFPRLLKPRLRIRILAGLMVLALSVPMLTSQITHAASPCLSERPLVTRSGFVRGLQGLLGLNLASRLVAQSILKKQIHKLLQGDITLRLKNYSASDLLQGRLKGARFSGKNLVIDKWLHVDALRAQTQTPVWYDLKQKTLMRSVVITFEAEMSQSSLNESLASAWIAKRAKAIRVKTVFGKQQFQLSKASTQLLADRLAAQVEIKPVEGNQDPVLAKILTGVQLNPSTGQLDLTALEQLSVDEESASDGLKEVIQSGVRKLSSPDKWLPSQLGRLQLTQLTLRHERLLLAGTLTLYPSAGACATIMPPSP